MGSRKPFLVWRTYFFTFINSTLEFNSLISIIAKGCNIKSLFYLFKRQGVFFSILGFNNKIVQGMRSQLMNALIWLLDSPGVCQISMLQCCFQKKKFIIIFWISREKISTNQKRSEMANDLWILQTENYNSFSFFFNKSRVAQLSLVSCKQRPQGKLHIFLFCLSRSNLHLFYLPFLFICGYWMTNDSADCLQDNLV